MMEASWNKRSKTDEPEDGSLNSDVSFGCRGVADIGRFGADADEGIPPPTRPAPRAEAGRCRCCTCCCRCCCCCRCTDCCPPPLDEGVEAGDEAGDELLLCCCSCCCCSCSALLNPCLILPASASVTSERTPCSFTNARATSRGSSPFRTSSVSFRPAPRPTVIINMSLRVFGEGFGTPRSRGDGSSVSLSPSTPPVSSSSTLGAAAPPPLRSAKALRKASRCCR
mmetsp:Transcript_10943/g.35959  ORF Transcript_10943/g.35959 Transcript_10943/m.35959 type:complete len:225 (-) Transcript_10943:18-692(-)